MVDVDQPKAVEKQPCRFFKARAQCSPVASSSPGCLVPPSGRGNEADVCYRVHRHD